MVTGLVGQSYFQQQQQQEEGDEEGSEFHALGDHHADNINETNLDAVSYTAVPHNPKV